MAIFRAAKLKREIFKLVPYWYENLKMPPFKIPMTAILDG
jgi:hypothetical protein